MMSDDADRARLAQMTQVERELVCNKQMSLVHSSSSVANRSLFPPLKRNSLLVTKDTNERRPDGRQREN